MREDMYFTNEKFLEKNSIFQAFFVLKYFSFHNLILKLKYLSNDIDTFKNKFYFRNF